MSFEIKEYRGASIVDVEARPGIYAWYYVPDGDQDAAVRRARAVLATFVARHHLGEIRLSDTYGMQLRGNARVERVPSDDGESIESMIASAMGEHPLLRQLVLSKEFMLRFTRPIYVGLSTELNARVYRDHYLGLDKYWTPLSPVGTYLDRAPPPNSVEDVMSKLGLGHSFALDARVRGIRPRDLLVQVMYLNPGTIPAEEVGFDPTSASRKDLRPIERLVQWMALPVCGRI